MNDDPKFEIRSFPVLDTGLGREAGYANDAELIAAAETLREELRQLLTPEAFAQLEAAEAEHRSLFGDDSSGEKP